MSRRFTKEELFAVRNHLPIQVLIEQILKMPCHTIEGLFHFACPFCRGFETATKRETNLARCFHCEKNFNTIDLVMLSCKMSFVESVKFLKRCLERGKASSAVNPANNRYYARTREETSLRELPAFASNDSHRGFTAAGQVLHSLGYDAEKLREKRRI